MPQINPHRIKFEHTMSLEEKWKKFLIVMGDSKEPNEVFSGHTVQKMADLNDAYNEFRVSKDNYLAMMAAAYAELKGIKDFKQKGIKETQ